MTGITSPRHICEFGPFRLDLDRHRLFRNGEFVPLSPKAIETLILLVQNPGKPLQREVLMDALWPNVTVEDANLTVAISQLRKAINQNGDKGEFIQTIPRVGYRFVGDVSEVIQEPESLSIKEPEASRAVLKNEARSRIALHARLPILISTIGALSLIAVIALLFFPRQSPRSRSAVSLTAKMKTLAVLPFQTVRPITAENEYLGPSIADSLNMRLSRIKLFAVRPTTSALKFDAARQNAVDAGRALGVQNVIEGKVEDVEGHLRVSAKLWRVSDGVLLWTDSFETQLETFSGVEEKISHRIAESLQLKLTSEEQQRLASKNTDNPDAFRAYLRGRHAWNKRTEAEMHRAVKFFQQAIDLDPAYAAAYAGLADSYLLLGDYNWEPATEAFPLARGEALRALEIDDALAEAHTVLAYAKLQFYWDFAAAEQEFLRAIELKPNYATAHHWYAGFLSAMGRSEEAMREIKIAQELDPLSLIIQANVGMIEYFAHQYDQAIEQEEKVLGEDPHFIQARRKLAYAFEAKGMEQQAIAEWLEVEQEQGASPDTLATFKNASSASGIKGYLAKAVEIERKQPSHRPKSISTYYARLGNRDQAFYWLDRAYDQRAAWLVFAGVDPAYDNLRTDPRFAQFLKRMGL